MFHLTVTLETSTLPITISPWQPWQLHVNPNKANMAILIKGNLTNHLLCSLLCSPTYITLPIGTLIFLNFLKFHHTVKAHHIDIFRGSKAVSTTWTHILPGTALWFCRYSNRTTLSLPLSFP